MSNAGPTLDPDHTSPASTSSPTAPSPTAATNGPLTFDFASSSTSQPPQSSLHDDAALASLRAQQFRRLVFLEDLVRNLDILVYAQLSAIYYMDATLPLLPLRLLPQWLFFTPKPLFLPLPPTSRPYAAGLITPFVICLLYHLLAAAPQGGEAVRGYLHGGFLIDFVGVQGPVSKWKLILGDLWVLGLQWVLLGLVGEVRAVRERGRGRGALVGLVGGGEGGGEVRTEDGSVDRLAEVEKEEEARDEDMEDEDEEGRKEGHPLDRFYGGQEVIAEVHVVQAMRKAWWWRDGNGP